MSRRPFTRALLASAAVAAALVLAGCDTDSVIAPSGRANAPLSDKMQAEIQQKGMDASSPILVRLFKEESELEVWKKNGQGEYALLKTYPICRWSGDLGPKVREGDRQAPEGFYTITPGQMNPNSSYYLAFNTGYPNAFDRAFGRTGSELMVHGDCSSRGCYAMTDEQMVEIYALARESFFGGQRAFQLQAYPFRMTAANMAKHRNSPHLAFWRMIKKGYDHFEVTRQEPKVDVCDKQYVFDAAPVDGDLRALSFNPRGKCPNYQVDPQIASLVSARERQEAAEYASLVAHNTPVVAARHGVDGGMNPVFLAKLNPPQAGSDSDRMPVVPIMATPGAIPRDGKLPATQVVPPAQAQPIAVATAEPAVETTPSAAAEKPSGSLKIGGLLDSIFSSKQTEPKPAVAAPARAPRKPSGTAVAAAKPAPVATMRTASAPVPPKPAPNKQVANAAPELRPRLSDESPNGSPTKPAASQLRTAYTTSGSSKGSSLLSGAQPLVPAGTFESRWSGLR